MAGLYLHIPFCRQRCTYCDFYFVTTQRSHAGFIAATKREIEHYAHHYAAREPISTIYFGGGTPSQLLPEEWFELLDALYLAFDTSTLQEVTAEVNPGDVDLDYLRELRHLGINRLSIGIQSFFEDDLKALNRSHSAHEAEEILALAGTAGFENYSIDLIFGIPEQPFEYWGANLEKADRFGVPHISTYGLTIEEGTPLEKEVRRGLVNPASDESMSDLYRFTMDYLRGRGYEHYEISSFARPGMRSQHNESYWNHSNYLGFGPSAHSFWWKGLPAHRWSNLRNLPRYEAILMQGHLPLEDRETLSLDRLTNEYIMLRLRTSDGIDLAELSQRYGADLLHEKATVVQQSIREGLLSETAGRLILTDEGKLVCNALTEKLLLDE
ncbi:MAG: radical SAM family heme chaperone HemW [Bacteroidota bacterium]